MGYLVKDKKKVQLIDTPGTLKRFDKMNVIEQRAHLAMKYCADMIIYIFDLTEPYPIEEQRKLLIQRALFSIFLTPRPEVPGSS